MERSATKNPPKMQTDFKVINGTPTSKTTLPKSIWKNIAENLSMVSIVLKISMRYDHSHASLLISMGENPLLLKGTSGT